MAAAAFPQQPFLHTPRLKRSLAYTPEPCSLTIASALGHFYTFPPALRLGGVLPHARRSPRAPLPTSGVTLHSGLSSSPSAGITPPSSLLLAHAPDHNPPADFSCPYFDGSLQVVANPCWSVALPGIISAILIWVSGPVPRSAPSVLPPVSSRRASASPYRIAVRHARKPRNATSLRGVDFGAVVIPLCSNSHTRSASRLHLPLKLPPGQPSLLHHALNTRLPNVSCGIATCPTQAIGTAGLPPAGSRPCRPLHPAPTSG